ncbi:MAG: type II toxin-antitoxin system tRNA(fMet)-specific endonuclease VapC [Eubacteriales bacterium]
MKYLFDTNICIYILNNRYLKILDQIEAAGIEEIAISTMTIAELVVGIEKSKRKEENKVALMEFLLPYKILDFTQEDSYKYGQIRADLERQGNVIGNMDMLIGSQAITRSLILVTNNEKEFKRIENLVVENWI